VSWKSRGADDSSPDLIVHGVLGMERSMDQIREEMRGILERLVRIHPLLLFSISFSVVSRRPAFISKDQSTPHEVQRQESDGERVKRRVDADI